MATSSSRRRSPVNRCPRGMASVREFRVPRLPARPRPMHPGLEHPADGVAREQGGEPRHVILVRMRQDDHVEAAIPCRDVLIEGDEQPVGIRPAIDEQPAPARRLQQDRVALPDIEHRELRRPIRSLGDGEPGKTERPGRRDDQRDEHGGSLRERGPRRQHCLDAGDRRAAPGSPAPPRDRAQPDRREERCRQRDVRPEVEARRRDRGAEPDDPHDERQREPGGQPERRGDERRRAQEREGPADHREDAGRHRDGDQWHDGEVHRGRDERQPAERDEDDRQGRRLCGEGDAQALREPAGHPTTAYASEPAAEWRGPGEQAPGGDDRELEPRVRRQRRIEQDEDRGCPRQCRCRPTRASRAACEEHDAGHHRRAKHRRRRARGDRVGGDRAHGQQQPRPAPASPQHARHDPRDERDVPAADRHDVTRAGRREVRREVPIHALPETDEDPRGETGLGFGDGGLQGVASRAPERVDRPACRRDGPFQGPRSKRAGRSRAPQVGAVIVVGRGSDRSPDEDRVARDDVRIARQRRRETDGSLPSRELDRRDLASVARRADGDDHRRPRSGARRERWRRGRWSREPQPGSDRHRAQGEPAQCDGVRTTSVETCEAESDDRDRRRADDQGRWPGERSDQRCDDRADGEPRAARQPAARPPAHEPAVTSARSFSSVFSPTTPFDCSSSTEANGRAATIFATVAGPTPGSESSCASVAVFRSMSPPGAPSGVPPLGAAWAASSRLGTWSSSPSWTGAAEIQRRVGPRHVDPWPEPTGRLDGIDDPSAIRQPVHAWLDHGARDFDEWPSRVRLGRATRIGARHVVGAVDLHGATGTRRGDHERGDREQDREPETDDRDPAAQRPASGRGSRRRRPFGGDLERTPGRGGRLHDPSRLPGGTRAGP